MKSKADLTPEEVVPEIQKHVLVDGFRIVADLEKSKGAILVDAATGREFLDFYGFFGSLPIGYHHPRFDDAEVQASLLQASHTKVANSDVYSVPYANFVKTFARVAGLPPLDRYFFIDGGALAVENALKAAMDWKVRKNLATGNGERGTEILHFERAFHGRSGYTMSLTNTDPQKTRYFAAFDWPRVPTPALDFSLSEPDRTKQVQLLEAEAENRIREILTEKGKDVAAIIIEPIQGEGGDNHFRPQWFQVLRKLCDEFDTLLIFDEVQTGLGITGKTWACQQFGVLPDILAFGKKTQVCGIMAGPRLDEVKENVFRESSRLNSTWGSNLTDMVRSTHFLEIIESENLIDNAARQGAHLKSELEALAENEPLISAVRGQGLMIAFDLPDSKSRDAFYRGLFDLGLLAIKSGNNSIRFRPPLDLQTDRIEQALKVIREQCKHAKNGEVTPPGTVSFAPSVNLSS